VLAIKPKKIFLEDAETGIKQAFPVYQEKSLPFFQDPILKKCLKLNDKVRPLKKFKLNNQYREKKTM